jgi:hypothetical protein
MLMHTHLTLLAKYHMPNFWPNAAQVTWLDWKSRVAIGAEGALHHQH